MELDEEESEFHLLIEIPEYEGTNLLATCRNYCLIGLETTHPILQLDDLVFEGSYEEVVGTNIFFEEKSNQAQQTKEIEYLSHCSKKIIFKKITLEPQK